METQVSTSSLQVNGPTGHANPDQSEPLRESLRAESLRTEQLDLLYSHIPFSAVLAILNAMILAVAQQGVVSGKRLWLWVAYILTINTVRLGWFYEYRHRTIPLRTCRRWERRFMLGVLLSGLGWGAAGVGLAPADEPLHQMFVVFVLAGMTAGAVMALSPRRDAFFLFVFPTLLPMIITFFQRGTTVALSMATMGCLFMLLSSAIAIRMSRTISASLELRYDNHVLITDLTNQVAQRHQAEAALRHAHDDLEARVRARTEELAHANLALRAEIEERQRMAQALQESIERFNRAVQGAQEGLWDAKWTSADWFNPNNPVYYSPRFRALLGFADHEFPNVMGSWASRVQPEDWDTLITTLRHHLENRTPFDVEFRMVTQGGETRWFAAAGQAIWDDLGNPVHMSGSLRDSTERKDLEDKLLQAQKLEAVGRLAAGVAHDFNNLLTPILGYAEVLMAKTAPGSTESRRLGDIRRAALHGANLVRQLLAFGRKQPVTPRVLNLNRELEESEELLRRTLGEDIEILLDLSDQVGQVRIDPTQLQQIILNLAANARDAMPEGGSLTVATTLVPQPLDDTHSTSRLYVRLTVSDTGAGMPKDVLAHVFEPFFTTKEVGKGSGLGLAVVEGIVAQAGGKIAVISQVGTGTKFQILLPEVTGIPDHASHTILPVPSGAGTVFVVEDNAAVREFSTQVLSEMGYHVLVARNGQEALDLAAHTHGPIDLLISDVVMPGISGLELARRLETSRPHLRVLFVSGHQEERLASRTGNQPVSPLLTKPFTAEELSRKIRELLAGEQAPSKG